MRVSVPEAFFQLTPIYVALADHFLNLTELIVQITQRALSLSWDFKHH